jgi:hypothetical protein
VTAVRKITLLYVLKPLKNNSSRFTLNLDVNLHQGCTNNRRLLALATEFCTVTPNMKYLRKVIRKIRGDQIRNTTIRNQLKQESVEVLMEKRTLRWCGHAVRMDLERRPKLVLEATPEGGRGRGRPRLERGECRKTGT